MGNTRRECSAGRGPVWRDLAPTTPTDKKLRSRLYFGAPRGLVGRLSLVRIIPAIAAGSRDRACSDQVTRPTEGPVPIGAGSPEDETEDECYGRSSRSTGHNANGSPVTIRRPGPTSSLPSSARRHRRGDRGQRQEIAAYDGNQTHKPFDFGRAEC